MPNAAQAQRWGGAAGQHRLGRDDREIGAAPGQRRLRGSKRQDQRGRQQRGEPGERDGGQLATLRNRRLAAEPGRLDAERGRRIGEVADNRGGQIRRHGDRHLARQRPRGGFAPGQAQSHRAAARQYHAQLVARHCAQAREIGVGDEFGGEGEDCRLAPVEQHRLAPAQRNDRRVEPLPGWSVPGRCRDQSFNHATPLACSIISRNRPCAIHLLRMTALAARRSGIRNSPG